MGHTSAAKNIFAFLGALESVLVAQGYQAEHGAGIAAAEHSLEAASAG